MYAGISFGGHTVGLDIIFCDRNREDMGSNRRPQYPPRVRHGLRTLGSWVLIPLKARMFGVCMHLFCVCVVLV
jgi:hypothetical protein